MTQIVKLINCEFFAHHGVMPEEHQVGGRFAVDIELSVNIEDAAKTDQLSKTVDYEQIYDILRTIMTTQKKYLIESLAYQIGKTVLNQFALVEGALVRVRKINPPVGGVCDYAEIEYNLTRGNIE